jgi:pimeloyl-ACP methyl ester carboxylesterase
VVNIIKNNIHYGKHKEQFAQLIRPNNNKKLAVVIVIHGGYWKDNHCLDSYATKAIVEYLQQFELAIWNLEYRRMNFIGDNNNAPWPVIFNDIAQGIDYLKVIQEKECLDLDRVFIIGHSAGGLLATWAASRLAIAQDSELYQKDPLKIKSVFSISGILNLSACQNIDQPEQVNRLMGGTRDRFPLRYQACDPNLLHQADIRLTIMHGKQDSCVDINQATSYCKNSPAKIDKIFLTDADHFSMLPHEGKWKVEHWQQVKDVIVKQLTLLNSYPLIDISP